MIGKRHLADVVQGRAAFQHVDKIGVHLIGKGCSARGFLRQTATVALQAHQVNAGFGIAVFHQLGQGEHQGVARLHQVAVAACEVALQHCIHRQ